MEPVRIFDDQYRYRSKPVRPDRTGRSTGKDRSTGRPAGLKFILEPLLSPDNDKWCRKLETKTVYILSGRYSSDPVEVLYIFRWKKQNFNCNRWAGRRYRFHLCFSLCSWDILEVTINIRHASKPVRSFLSKWRRHRRMPRKILTISLQYVIQSIKNPDSIGLGYFAVPFETLI